jgi:hypothetical protein
MEGEMGLTVVLSMQIMNTPPVGKVGRLIVPQASVDKAGSARLLPGLGSDLSWVGESEPSFLPVYTAAMPEPKLYSFSTHVGAACAKQFRTFQDLAEKLKMDVHDLMRQCNAHAPPTRALVKGLARELKIDESFLQNLADEVRKNLGDK